MRLKKSFIILIIIAIMFSIPINTSAYQPYKSDVYTQGVYELGELDKYTVYFNLISDSKTYLLLVDNNKELLSYMKLPYKEKIKLESLGPKVTIAIIGPGEVAVVYE